MKETTKLLLIGGLKLLEMIDQLIPFKEMNSSQIRKIYLVLIHLPWMKEELNELDNLPSYGVGSKWLNGYFLVLPLSQNFKKMKKKKNDSSESTKQ